MKFVIDGSEWNFPHMDSLSIEERLAALREKVAAEDRVIVDMLSDGESLEERDLLTVPDDIQVDVITDTVWGVGLEILEEIKNSLLEVFKGLQSVLDSRDPFEPSMLDETKRQLHWVGEAAKALQNTYPEYDGQFPQGEPLLDSVAEFEACLAEGHYAEAQIWHEKTWKNEVLPPFLDAVKKIKEWLDAKNDEETGDGQFEVNDR
ncbi:MAG: hypothetical protein ACOYD9_08515 [Pyramidobacter sp.]